MSASTSSREPAGLAGFLTRIVKAVLPGFLVSMVLVFLTTELAKLSSMTSDRVESNPSTQLSLEAARPRSGPHKPVGRAAALILGLVPTALLGIILFVFLNSGGAKLLDLQNPAPGSVLFNTSVLSPGEIELHITNPGPAPITISRLAINDSIMPYAISPAETIPQFGNAVVHFAYPWVEGEAYTITLLTPDSATFTTSIDAAGESALPSNQTLLTFTLMGAGAGLIPLFIGMAWVPVFSAARRRKFIFPMALSLGLLAYSGFIVTNEALKIVQGMDGAYQGAGLVAIGVMSSFLLLETVSRWQAVVGQRSNGQGLDQALLLGLGTGLRSFAIGLAIGASFSGGATILGTLLLVSFLVQNFTEGLRWMAAFPSDRTTFWRLLVMAAIGGIPAVFGIWTGAYTDSQLWTTVFLAVGGGAILQSAVEYYRRIQRGTARQPRPLTVLAGVMLGWLGLFIGGLLL